MKVRVKFFASLRESIGVSELDLDLPDQAQRQHLMDALCNTLDSTQYTQLAAPRNTIAVNQNLTRGDFKLKHEDEIAFLPPITGG